MLLLSRKPGQSITIQPDPNLDFTTPLGTLFTDGPIEVQVNQIGKGGVNLGITAHRQFCILRNELTPYPHTPSLVIPVNRTSREILAHNVFALRVQRKLSSEQLAEDAGLALTTVVAVENSLGLIDLNDLDRLAKALQVNVDMLLRD